MVQLSPQLTQKLFKLTSFNPTKQRLGIGAFALVSQTLVDANNKNVDEETRKYSAIRTAAKVIITTAGGITARALGQKFGEWLINNDIVKIPENYIKEWKEKPMEVLRQELSALKGTPLSQIPNKINPKDFAKIKYGMALGAACSVVAAAISVFAWDMPFTNKIMNLIMGKYNKYKENKAKTNTK
ncbi:MAG: hypothetical protein WC860_10155 [Candidatus Margulisiibacteriota bacterium]|jgi:hypothetical protein